MMKEGMIKMNEKESVQSEKNIIETSSETETSVATNLRLQARMHAAHEETTLARQVCLAL